MCEAFGCTPLEALQQDPAFVWAILEYRLLEAAKRLHNEDATKLTPGMAKLWLEMVEATNS